MPLLQQWMYQFGMCSISWIVESTVNSYHLQQRLFLNQDDPLCDWRTSTTTWQYAWQHRKQNISRHLWDASIWTLQHPKNDWNFCQLLSSALGSNYWPKESHIVTSLEGQVPKTWQYAWQHRTKIFHATCGRINLDSATSEEWLKLLSIIVKCTREQLLTQRESYCNVFGRTSTKTWQYAW